MASICGNLIIKISSIPSYKFIPLTYQVCCFIYPCAINVTIVKVLFHPVHQICSRIGGGDDIDVTLMGDNSGDAMKARGRDGDAFQSALTQLVSVSICDLFRVSFGNDFGIFALL